MIVVKVTLIPLMMKIEIDSPLTLKSTVNIKLMEMSPDININLLYYPVIMTLKVMRVLSVAVPVHQKRRKDQSLRNGL